MIISNAPDLGSFSLPVIVALGDISLISSIISLLTDQSNPAVGSSSKRISGFLVN